MVISHGGVHHRGTAAWTKPRQKRERHFNRSKQRERREEISRNGKRFRSHASFGCIIDCVTRNLPFLCLILFRCLCLLPSLPREACRGLDRRAIAMNGGDPARQKDGPTRDRINAWQALLSHDSSRGDTVAVTATIEPCGSNLTNRIPTTADKFRGSVRWASARRTKRGRATNRTEGRPRASMNGKATDRPESLRSRSAMAS